MRIVVRNSPGHELETLSQAERSALHRWYGNAATEEDEGTALAIIQRAKIMGGWIACDCMAGRASPLLAPIQQEHTFTLRRLTARRPEDHQQDGRPNHAEACPFHVDKDGAPALIDRHFQIRPILKPDRLYVDPLPAMPDGLADLSERERPRPRERNDRPSRLGSILWRILERAEINIVPPLQEQHVFSLSGQLSRMRASAKEFRVLRTWTLNALTSTWAADYWDGDSRWQRLLAASRNEWPLTVRRTGFMLLYAKSVSAQSVMPASSARRIDIMGKVRQPLQGDSSQRGPFLVLLNADFGDDDDGPVRAIQAYAQPVYNPDTLFPVESGFERQISHLLFWLQDALFEALPDLRVRIIKPLFAIETPIGLCRPDFVIDATYKDHPSIKLIVEAMGRETKDYQAAKAKALPRMERIGPVFHITPADLAGDHAARSARRLMEWGLEQLRHPKVAP
ncbi:hypothetical protein N7E02_03895 (plasmid) [Aliirhizobium terrae]|uniref:hypothetical protein n=1 Tax=Terrirhizobium terrae TaxID=2926709 RepID=UPI002574E794|nr:hypothetical protein [Rhizobium sp. CC-CFT758]WJH38559.1 hypothetical protein N7E02_03895 [Rhizobium sp. CC-CFT758]